MSGGQTRSKEHNILNDGPFKAKHSVTDGWYWLCDQLWCDLEQGTFRL